MYDFLVTMGPAYAAVQTLLVANYARSVYGFMSNAVTKVVLLDGGKQVTFTTKSGTKTINIREIKKQEHEKTLIETYEESIMFPLKVGAKTYYLNG